MFGKLRKALAVLVALTMLCTLLPLGALSVAAETKGNLIVNGNFETGTKEGWDRYQSTAIVSEAAYTGNYGAKLSGNGGWGGMLNQTVSVTANKGYILKMWINIVQNGVNIQIKDGNSNGASLGGGWYAANEMSGWTELTWVLAPSTGAIYINFCGSGNGTAEIAYLDDVSLVKAPLVTNGDFETGNDEGWETYQGTSVKAAAAYTGNYGMHLTGNGGWGGMLKQTFAVTAGANYELSFWMKAVQNGANIQIKDSTTQSNLTSGGWFTTTTWTYKTYTITPTSNSFFLNFCGGGNGIAESVYVDDVVLRELKDPSDDGFITNGDFETGTANPWNIYGSSAVCEEAAYSGDYGLKMVSKGDWGGTGDQTFTMEVGKKYAVSFMIKTVKNGVNFQFKDNGATQTSGWIDNATDWTKKTFEITAASTNGQLNFCGGGNNLETVVYLDDVRVIEVKDPTYDGYIYNGDFEAGSLTMWQVYQSTELSAEAAYSGNFGCKMIGSGGWGATLAQDITLEPGKSYKISFWYKSISNGINFQLKDGDNKLNGKYLSKAADWTLYESTFEAGYSSSATVNFSGSGIGSTDEVWIDDIKLENLSGEEMDRNTVMKNSGTSIRDVSDSVRGLAFRFFLDVNNTQLENEIQLVPNTGTIKLYKYADVEGTLVETGALLTTRTAIGTGDMTLANVGNGTVKVPAVKLFHHEEDNIGFAVRVINIPDKHTGTNVYVRPYYTYEVDGEQFTVYGNTISDNYDAVASVRRSLKVLAIGNSFSVDAMQNHLYDVLDSADYDQIILGNLYVGGCSLDQHWGYINGNQSAYEFYKNDNNGQWTKTPNYNALTALQEETWDIITVQQVSSNSGRPETFGNLQNLVNWINDNKTNPNGKIYWHMTWAYQQNSTHEAFPNYGSNQMTMYNAIVNTTQNTVLQVEGIDGIIPAGTAIQNLRGTELGDTLTADGYHLKDSYGDYTAALTWYAALTGESLDLVDYVPDSVADYIYNIKRSVAHAIAKPYEIADLSEVVLLSGSDFQPSTWDKGFAIMDGIRDGILSTDGISMFDGLLFTGDYTPQHGHDNATEGLGQLDAYTDDFVAGNKVYVEGNHDAPTVEKLSPYGNNDPLNGPYGVFVIHEEDFGQFGAGDGEKVGADLKAYFDQKTNSGWDKKKPIFVMTHVPLHFNWRTVSDVGAGKNAEYIVNALNEAGEDGYNIIFLFGHNHSSDYDSYLGGSSIYLAKGDTMLIANPENYKEYQEVELKFTYMNSGYVGYFADYGTGMDHTLTMTSFRIQADGSVIITRYDADGYHNLKSKGVAHMANEHNVVIPVNEDVYGPQRIVTATTDEEYTEN